MEGKLGGSFMDRPTGLGAIRQPKDRTFPCPVLAGLMSRLVLGEGSECNEGNDRNK